MSLPSVGRQALSTARSGKGLTAWLLRHLLPAPDSGQITIEAPSGHRLVLRGSKPGLEVAVSFHRWRALWRLLTGGDLGFAEAHIDGDWSSPDLTGLLEFAARNTATVEHRLRGLLPVRLAYRLRHLLNANTPVGARRNISFHYDLGNAFYRLWLDPLMIYSSGLYDQPSQTLEAAQESKLRRIVELLKLELDRDHNILEIGCGWGALAVRLALLGNKVAAVTLSSQQLTIARETAAAKGVSGCLTLELKDYREIEGKFDRIVSIEMLEAVGERYWPLFFQRLYDRLAPGGRAVIQVITIDERRFAGYRTTADFIQRHVFPGGMLLTKSAVVANAAAAGLRLTSMETFGESYALTLEEWRRRFLASWPQICALGANLRFRRFWHYYLCYCAAGFRAGTIDVGLYVLERTVVGAKVG